MIEVEPVDVLVIAPHPDDGELGMAGGMLRLREQGLRVGLLDLTDGEPTPHGSRELRAAETTAATRILELDWRGNLGLPNRSLEPTLAAREQLAGVIRLAQPRWLFAPYWQDAHPDHVAATQLVEAARFWAKLSKTEMPGTPHHPERIYHYYSVHLRHVPQPTWVLDISKFWTKKRAAIEAYQSQFVTGRETLVPTPMERFETDAAYWGKTINVAYGEPYVCREPLGLTTFEGLI